MPRYEHETGINDALRASYTIHHTYNFPFPVWIIDRGVATIGAAGAMPRGPEGKESQPTLYQLPHSSVRLFTYLVFDACLGLSQCVILLVWVCVVKET